MSNRKDILKNLGIPEYPWSSDDDDPPVEQRHAPAALPRTSDTGHSAPTSAATSAATSAVTSAATSTPLPPARNQFQTRELFFSLLNRTPRSGPVPSTSSGNHQARAEEMPLSYLSRANHTPAPELRERPTPYGDRADMERVLALRQLTCINNGRFSRYSIPRRTRPGTVVPQECNSISMSVRLPYTRRLAPRNQPSPANNASWTSRQSGVDNLSSNIARRINRTMEYHRNFDDEEDVMVTPPTAHAPSNPATSANTAPANTTETSAQSTESEQASPNNNSGANISLEEEIVEILDEPAAASTFVDMDLIDQARAAAISSCNDSNMASTVQPDEVDAPEIEQQNRGVKRKRRESSDDRPADQFTVKDFNQSLLRLLECPVCLEVMEPPMSQCRRGHLVCNRCRARLASCPVCRTTFSSVRNRAMEGVAEMLRYPCRHGCGREVRLRRRAPHESSCADRKYLCPAPVCTDMPPLARSQLANHFHSKHLDMVKLGARHQFGIKVNSESHCNWLLMALDEFFHMKVDVDIRTWGVVVYVAYIGPKCNAKDFAYEVSIDGQHNSRKMQYKRATHSDLESSSLNVSRQDCFHLSLDQALNFIRFKNRHCDAEKYLEFTVEISKIDPPPSLDDSDS